MLDGMWKISSVFGSCIHLVDFLSWLPTSGLTSRVSSSRSNQPDVQFVLRDRVGACTAKYIAKPVLSIPLDACHHILTNDICWPRPGQSLYTTKIRASSLRTLYPHCLEFEMTPTECWWSTSRRPYPRASSTTITKLLTWWSSLSPYSGTGPITRSPATTNRTKHLPSLNTWKHVRSALTVDPRLRHPSCAARIWGSTCPAVSPSRIQAKCATRYDLETEPALAGLRTQRYRRYGSALPVPTAWYCSDYISLKDAQHALSAQGHNNTVTTIGPITSKFRHKCAWQQGHYLPTTDDSSFYSSSEVVVLFDWILSLLLTCTISSLFPRAYPPTELPLPSTMYHPPCSRCAQQSTWRPPDVRNTQAAPSGWETTPPYPIVPQSQSRFEAQILCGVVPCCPLRPLPDRLCTYSFRRILYLSC